MTIAGPLARSGAALVLCLVLVTSACSGDDPEPEGPSAPAQSTATGASFEIQTRTTVAEVTGKLPWRERKRLSATITKVAQRWFNAAYVGGDYPRSNFEDAFPGFTPGARAEARRDRRLLTNKAIGSRISDVTPTRSRLWLDVLAVRKRAVGVTARFALGFRTEGELSREFRVTGRLLMTRNNGGWRIFGYDVARGVRA
jgi:hypothetical protein